MKDLDVGTIISDKYVLVRLLGAGAMGQVWVARHQGLHQTFALKLMVPASRSGDVEDVATSLKRFENEAQIAAALSRKSRHIVRVSDYGIDDGAAYLVMELLEGEPLDERIGYGRKLDPSEVSTIVTQIAKGLTVAHTEEVTHRDLKPANVFLTRTEEGDLLVKVLDFGIARMARHIVRKDTATPVRLTAKGLVLGSPGYMSPEQAMADPFDVRADVWALAVVAFEALAGIPPFFSTDVEETLARICKCQATPLRALLKTAPLELEAVFDRAFSRKIDARFQTAADLAAALAAALPAPATRLLSHARGPGQPAEALTETAGGVSLKVPMQPRRVVSAVAIGAGVGLVVAGAMLAQHVLRSEHDTMLIAPRVSPSAPIPTQQPALVASIVAPSEPLLLSAKAPAAEVTRAPSVKRDVLKTVTPPPHASAVVDSVPPPDKPVDRSAVF